MFKHGMLVASALSLAVGAPAWAQNADPTQPPPDGAGSGVDWAAAKARSEAEAAAFTAAAQAFTARKAALDAELALQKGAVGTVDAPTATPGALELKEGAMRAEGSLLSARATDDAAAKLVEALNYKDEKTPIVVSTDPADLDFSDAFLFDMQVAEVRESLDFASRLYVRAESRAASLKLEDEGQSGPPRDRADLAGAVTLLGAGLDAVSKLGAYFKTDHVLGGLEVERPGRLLEAALLQHLMAKGYAARSPRSVVATSVSAVSEQLSPLTSKYVDVLIASAHAKARADALAASDNVKETSTARYYEDAARASSLAVEKYEALRTYLTTAEDGDTPLAKIVRQKAVLKASAGALLLVAEEKPVGAYYTRRNLWTFFGGPPVHAMGGTTVAYVLLDPATGDVKASGNATRHGGYRTVRNVEKLFAK